MDTFETYCEIKGYAKTKLICHEPSCFNGVVRVRKYKVTIEQIEEPINVIQERLQKMWNECDNWHHWEPLKAEAAKYGIVL